jgi:hypothetical protein
VGIDQTMLMIVAGAFVLVLLIALCRYLGGIIHDVNVWSRDVPPKRRNRGR